MKKSFLLLLTIFLFSTVYSQYVDTSFNMPTSNQMMLSLNQTYKSDTSFVLDINNALYGLSISGKCVLNANKSIVRVLLCDDCNNEYLIYENYTLLADSNICDFNNIGIETSLLDSIILTRIRIQVIDADLFISNVHYTTNKHGVSHSQIQARRNIQNNAIITQLNNNLQKRNMTWRAGSTFISLLSHEEKKTLFGTDTLPNLYGIEYYKGGVYISPDYEYPSQERLTSQYVDNFDWRDRHGKNWLTSVKSQGKCGSCWVYSAVDLVESYMNLYYNQLLNYDLSEQEIISCSYDYPSLFSMNNGGCTGGHTSGALKYIQKKGVVLEECFPYADYYYAEDLRIGNTKYTLVDCSEKCDSAPEIVKIKNYIQLNNTYFIDTIKSYLLEQPLAFSVYYRSGNTYAGHAMLMVGYKTIHTGDSLCIDYLSDHIIEASEELEGTTAYIVKNCWGTDWGDNGYGYLVTNASKIKEMYQISGDIISKIYNYNDQLYKDEDGDGYYTWGTDMMVYYLNLPLYVPKQQDGDDSDVKFGPMNSYGHLMDLNPDNRDTIFITEQTNWNSENYVWQHVVIKNGGLLNISSNIKFYKGVNILVQNGGELNIDGGFLENVNIEIVSGGKLSLKNKGKIKKHKRFYTANGAIVRINNGLIN